MATHLYDVWCYRFSDHSIFAATMHTVAKKFVTWQYILCLIFFSTYSYVWPCTDSYSLFVSGISLTLDQVCVIVCWINKYMYVFVCCDLWLESLQLNIHLILTLCFFGCCSGRCLVSMQIKLTRLLRRILRLESWILLIWSNGCRNLGSHIFRTRAVYSSSYM